MQRIKLDDGCYEVRGVDAQGQRFKAKYAPNTLLLLKMKINRGRAASAVESARALGLRIALWLDQPS